MNRIGKPPTLPTFPVTFDAVGAGGSAASASSLTLAHTAALGAAVMAAVSWTSGTRTPTATYNGVSMSSLASVNKDNNASSFGGITLFGLLNAGTGSSQSLVISMGSSTTTILGGTCSYAGVASFGTAATNYGVSNPESLSSVSSATGQMIFQVFSQQTGTAQTITSYNQTSRYNTASSTTVLLIGDAAGASSVSFSASSSAGTPDWAAAAIPLIP